MTVTVNELQDYYANLLIRQYNQQPKARATIQALCGSSIASLVEFSVRAAMNIDTAIGLQLDILGGLIGVKRVIHQPLDAINFFTFADSGDMSLPGYGFSDASDPDSMAAAVYWWRPQDSIGSNWSLDDTTYRKFIKYMAAVQSMELTIPNVFALMDNLNRPMSSASIVEDSIGTPMEISYYILEPNGVDPLVTAILGMKALPQPAGVTVNVFINGTAVPY